MTPHVLLVEDEETMAELLADNLKHEGYRVSVAHDGQVAMEAWRTLAPDLVVLDVMLPRMSGFDVCREMRSSGDITPVLFLSARSQTQDRIQGLKVGGDDYLPKPFDLLEFLLRVNNMLKRTSWVADAAGEASHNFAFAGHKVNYRSYTVTLASGQEEVLGDRELRIFKLLAERAPEAVSRDDILDDVWGDEVFPSSRTVDNYVMKLRKLFEPDPSQPIFFHTVWGVGYRFTPEAGTGQDARE